MMGSAKATGARTPTISWRTPAPTGQSTSTHPPSSGAATFEALTSASSRIVDAEPARPPRRTVKLSAEEAWTTIEGSHTAIFTTMRRDGTPISLPVWFVVIDRIIFMTTSVSAKKVARVRNNPRAAFVVESGHRWAELRAVHLTGQASVVDDDDLAERVRAASKAKYDAFRIRPVAMPTATRERYGRQAANIRFVPDERILSWDNARMFESPPTG